MQGFVSNLFGRVSCVLPNHMHLQEHCAEGFGEKQWMSK